MITLSGLDVKAMKLGQILNAAPLYDETPALAAS